MKNRKRIPVCLVVLGLILLGGCSEGPQSQTAAADRSTTTQTKAVPKEAEAPAPAKEMTQAQLVAQGQKVYKSNCTACHNMDPNKKGSLGPAIAGSSEALVEARVVHGTYPPGYTPKSDSRLMVAMPYLAKDVKALAAYLQSVQ